jgi:hypothetical protein
MLPFFGSRYFHWEPKPHSRYASSALLVELQEGREAWEKATSGTSLVVVVLLDSRPLMGSNSDTLNQELT